MKRELIKEIMTHDVERFKRQADSVSSILANSPLNIASIIARKCPTGNYTHLRTQDAWTRRISAAKVEDLENALKFLKEGIVPEPSEETILDVQDEVNERPPDTDLSRSEDAIIASSVTQNEAFNANTQFTTPLSEIPSLMEHRKEEISSWYSHALEKLNAQKETLREEQYRRRKAQLRVEYWAKMDKETNNVNPTVINFQ